MRAQCSETKKNTWKKSSLYFYENICGLYASMCKWRKDNTLRDCFFCYVASK